jgi:hypothetical protein
MRVILQVRFYFDLDKMDPGAIIVEHAYRDLFNIPDVCVHMQALDSSCRYSVVIFQEKVLGCR